MESMKESILSEHKLEDLETVKEVDYLKKIRINTRKKIWFGIGGVILALTILVFVKVLVYGSPSENYIADISVENNCVKITGTFVDSAAVPSIYKIFWGE